MYKKVKYYYSVYGINGLGVYDDWDLARMDVMQLDLGNTKKFCSFYEAKAYAIEKHNNMAIHRGFTYLLVDDHIKVTANKLIILKELYRLV